MKLLERENTVVLPPVRPVAAPRREVRPEPVVRPDIHVRARVVTRPRVRRKSDLGARVVTFGAIMGLTYVFSTLAGYVSLEGARQTARRGIERATYARAEAKEARTAIEALTNPTALRAWADGHGFVETGAVAPPVRPTITTAPQGGGLVARL